MTTSGTTAFNPGLGDLVLNALGRIRLRGPAITIDHLQQARSEANLLNVEWMNRGPNLWLIDQEVMPLVQGQATYAMGSDTVGMFEVMIQQGSNVTAQRMMAPLSRTEYATQPDKTTQGTPNAYWFNRQAAPQMVVWPPPDAAGYTITYWRMRQQQDAKIGGGVTLDVPYRWLDAFTAGLAARLAMHFAQDLEQVRFAQYERAFDLAADEDTEGTNLYITPGLAGYYR